MMGVVGLTKGGAGDGQHLWPSVSYALSDLGPLTNELFRR